MIKKLCYELYKLDWERNHMITADIKMDSIKDYYEGLLCMDDIEYTYVDYIEEFGYNGELYVCFDEFVDSEYRDKAYMCSLLSSAGLISMYYADVSKEE